MSLQTLRNWLGSIPRKRCRRPSKLALALEHLEDRTTPAAIAWDGGGGNLDWLNRFNWTGDVLPTLADDVTISGASGAVEITNTFGVATARTLVSDNDIRVVTGVLELASDSVINGNVTLGGVAFDGVITGTGTLTINGDLTWLANGVMAGTGKTILNGTTTITGSTFGSLRQSRVVENAGDATVVAGSSFVFRDTPVFRNLTDGTLTFANGSGIGSFFAAAGSKLVNEGTMVVAGPAGTTIVVATENSGHIDADAPLTLSAGLTNSGTIDAASTLSASGTTANSGTITAAGTMTLGATTNSGTIDANGNASMTSLTNTATGVVDATGTLSPGAVTNHGTITAGGAANLSTLNNTGTITAASTLTANGTTANSGTITATGTLTTGATTNSGTIDANGNASMSSLTNTGIVDVAGATYSVGSGSNATSIQLGAATTMTAGGTFTLLSGSTITGGVVVSSTFNQLAVNGTVSVTAVRLTGGTINALAGSELTVGTLEQNGTVTGLGTVIVSDRWTFTNGSLTGGGRFVTRGTSTLSGGFFATIGNRIVENAGHALVDANQSFTFTAGANWTNLAGSVFELRTTSTASTFFVNPADRFTNRGTILKTGIGAGTLGLPVVNEAGGTVQVVQGTLNLPGVTSAGNFDVASGAVLRLTSNNTLQAGATSIGAGEIQLAGNLTVTGAAALGNLKVESGTVTANAPLSVTNLNLNGTLAGTSPITVSNLTLVNGTVNTALNVGNWTFSSGTLTGTGPVTVNGAFNWTGGTQSGSGSLTVNGPFTMSGGNMASTGTATINGPFTWTGGSMSGTGRTILNGTSTLSGALNADNRQIENAGTATVTSGAITFRNAARWTNLPGGVFELRSGDAIGVFFASGQFINQGKILKTTAGTAAIRLPVINQAGGVIEVQQGTLQLVSSNASSAGTFNVAGGATLSIGSGSGTFTLLAGATGVGAGEVLIAGSPLVVAGATSMTNLRTQGGAITLNAPLTTGNFTHRGNLTGSSNVTVNGHFVWAEGGMSGTGRTILNGTGTIGGSSVVILDGRTIDNAGTVTVTAAPSVPLQFRGNAVWNNLAGATLELTATGTIAQFFASATSAVNNAGTIRKTGTIGNVSSIGVRLINSGRVEILGGDLTTAANSRSSGVFDIAANGRWMVTSGPHFLDAGATTTGAGLLFLQNNLTVTGVASIARLQHNGGILTANAPLTIGDYLFNVGTLTGTGRTTLTGMSSFTGPSPKVISAHTIDNAGTVTWSGTGAIQTTGTVTFNNLAGAVFDITNDTTFAPTSGTPTFNNAGTLRKSGGGGPIFPAFGPRTTWGVPLNNSGLLDIRTGNFQPVPPFGLPPSVSMLNNTGTIQVGTATSSAAALVLPVVPGVSGAPTYTLTGGTLTGTGQVGFPSPPPISVLVVAPGATLGGTLTVHGSVVNQGTVSPGNSPGTLTVTGNYTQTATGRLVIELAGDAVGQYDRLSVGGSAALGGTLDLTSLDGFVPLGDESFQVLQARSVSGDFAHPEEGYDLNGYRVATPSLTGTSLSLETTGEPVGPYPTIDPIDDRTVNEGETVTLTAAVSGAQPPGPLTFSLAPGAPEGASIDPVTGEFTFRAVDGPNTYHFQILISDPFVPFDPADGECFSVTVLNVAPAVTITGGQSALNEGDQFTASGSFADPGTDAWTATVDYGDGTGVQELTLNADKTFALDHHYLDNDPDNGTFTITVRVFDGFEYGTATFEVEVANLPPTVVAAADQTADENTEREFDLGSFTDLGVNDAPWTVTVDWGDGTAPVVFDTFTQGLLVPRSHTYTDDGTYTVTVTVTDKDGAARSDTFDVEVANLAPVAAVSGPDSGVRGQARTFTLSATDPSPVDEAAGFTFSIDWGDGTTQIVTGLSGTTVEHTYAATGDYIVTVTATDKDDGVSEADTHAISIVVAEVQDGVLVVGGTTGNDAIQVKKGAGDGASLEVTVNGVNLGEFTGLTRAVVYGQAGDDILDATGSTDVALEIYGGAGNDHLKGGSKDDILDGGAGDDELLGGLGRDVLVGGSGSDRIVSQSGDDILIGGLFMGVDLTEARRAALLNVSEEWSSGDSFATRVATLTPLLLALVEDDGVTDYLTGSAGNDWYFAHTSGTSGENDVLSGNSSQDIVTTI